MGAVECHIIDATKEFSDEYVLCNQRKFNV